MIRRMFAFTVKGTLGTITGSRELFTYDVVATLAETAIAMVKSQWKDVVVISVERGNEIVAIESAETSPAAGPYR